MATMMTFQREVLKDIEARLHEALFSNVQILTYKFKPSEDFMKVFKPDMFKKSNVAAFQHVTHYLLSTFNPELTSKMVPTWPIFEKRQEASFRKEIITLIDEINHLYPHADLPKLMYSHYVLPGGLKIVNLLFSLSQLVLYEVLKRNHCKALLISSKASEDPNVTDLTIKTIQRKTKCDADKVRKIIQESDQYKNQALEKAQQMVNDDEKVGEELSQYRKALLEKQANYKGPTIEEAQKQVQQAKGSLKSIEELAQLFAGITTSQTFLLNDETVMNYNKQEFAVSDNIAKEIENKEGKLDLKRLFYYVENSISQAKFNGYNLLELEEIRKLAVHLKEQFVLIGGANKRHFKELYEAISLFDMAIKRN